MMLVPETIAVFPSAARTATATSDWITNRGFRGMIADMDVTANTSGEITLSIEGRIGAGTYTIATATQVTDTTDATVRIYPGLKASLFVDDAAIANVFNDVLPSEFRFVVTHADSGSVTYSLSACLLP